MITFLRKKLLDVLYSSKNIKNLIPGNFYWKDSKGCYLDANNAFLDLIGRESITGKTDHELWPVVADTLLKNDRNVILNDKTITVEEKLILKNGAEKFFRVTKAPWRNRNNEIIGIIANLSDITQLKGKEAELDKARKIMEASTSSMAANIENIVICTPGSIYWKDLNGVYLGCNDFIVKEAGLQSRSDIIGKKDEDLWPAQAEAIRSNDLKVIQGGKLISMEETVEGRVFFSMKMPLRDEKNNIIGVICNSHDITYLKEIEAELRAAKERSEIANQAKSEFLAIVSHELRSPLTSILGMVYFLTARTNISKEELAGYVRNIFVSAKHLLTLVNDFLDFAKLEAGKFELSTAPFDLKALIIETVSILMPQATAKGLEIIIDYIGDAPHMILGDSRALRQIVINLVGNAIKFTNKGSIFIKIDCLEKLGDMAKLCISVRDTGIGIPEDKLAIIFDHFQQADSSYRRRYGGTGLGLSITKKLVSIMDGTLNVESKEDEGSTFFCHLIFRLQNKSIVEHPWLLHQAHVPILIIDDTLRGEIIKKQISPNNCHVVSGDSALNFFIAEQEGASPCRIVMIDDGINAIKANELAKQISKISHLRKPMLILLTNSASMLTRKAAASAGFFDCIVKPIQPLELQTHLVAAWEAWLEAQEKKNKNGYVKQRVERIVSLKNKKDCERQNLKITVTNQEKIRVLLVDDEENIQFIHSEFLKELNCLVDKAGDGEMALKILEENSNYDLIILDMGLPVISGPDVIKIYRTREKLLGKRVPVIALTGYSSQKDKDYFKEAGADEVIIKPVTIEQLKKTLQNYCSRSEPMDNTSNSGMIINNV